MVYDPDARERAEWLEEAECEREREQGRPAPESAEIPQSGAVRELRAVGELRGLIDGATHVEVRGMGKEKVAVVVWWGGETMGFTLRGKWVEALRAFARQVK